MMVFYLIWFDLKSIMCHAPIVKLLNCKRSSSFFDGKPLWKLVLTRWARNTNHNIILQSDLSIARKYARMCHENADVSGILGLISDVDWSDEEGVQDQRMKAWRAFWPTSPNSIWSCTAWRSSQVCLNRDNSLILHFIVLGRNLEVVVLVFVVVLLWKLLGCLDEVDLPTASASTTADDIARINFLHIVIICLVDCNVLAVVRDLYGCLQTYQQQQSGRHVSCDSIP